MSGYKAYVTAETVPRAVDRHKQTLGMGPCLARSCCLHQTTLLDPTWGSVEESGEGFYPH